MQLTGLERRRLGKLNCRLVVAGDSREVRQAVVLCHGFGAPGDDLVGIAAEWTAWDPHGLSGTLFCFPEAPIELEFGPDSRAWWPINFERLQEMALSGDLSDLENFVPAELEANRLAMLEVLEQLRQQFGVAQEQIFLGGFSQGAMLATDVALHVSANLAGLFIWSGITINRSAWEKLAPSKHALPVLQSHGTYDPILPFAGATRLRDLLKGGGLDVKFLQFAGQHTIDRVTLVESGRRLVQSR